MKPQIIRNGHALHIVIDDQSPEAVALVEAILAADQAVRKEGVTEADVKSAYDAIAIAEQRVGPYRFDGFSDKASWILEVGNTNSEKLDSAIEWEWVERFSLIPYQGRCDFLGAKEPPPRGLVVIDFEWEPGLVLEWL